VEGNDSNLSCGNMLGNVYIEDEWTFSLVVPRFILQCYKTIDHSENKKVNNIILVRYNIAPMPINAFVALYYINKIIQYVLLKCLSCLIILNVIKYMSLQKLYDTLIGKYQRYVLLSII